MAIPSGATSIFSYRNGLHDGAMSVVKGALCTVLQLPTGRSTNSVKFLKGNKGVISIGAVAAVPSLEQQKLIQDLIQQKVDEMAPFQIYRVERALAERLYGDIMYDEFGVPASVKTLRLVVLEEWNMNANSFPVVRDTSFLKGLRIEKYKMIEGKTSLGVHFELDSDVTVSESDYAFEDMDNIITDSQLLPSIEQVLPASGVSEGPQASTSCDDQTVTPWVVAGGADGAINYDKIIKKFGCARIEAYHIDRIEALTKRRAHHFLRRGLFVSHRDLDCILNAYEQNKPFYLYTGRGPSTESLHLGHIVPFMFTKYLQDAFDVPLVIQLTDDEKFIFKENLTTDEVYRLAYSNAKDIIACGFDPNKTFIFSDLDYIGTMYPLILRIQKKVTCNQVRGIFGFGESDSIAKHGFPAVQAAPSFSCCFPSLFGDRKNIRCLIPQGIDQDPYFRLTRHCACRLGLLKPALIHSRFLPALTGFQTKMSSSVESTSVYVTDDKETIKNKIFKYAYSGGQATEAEQREKGANLDVDVSYQYISYLLEDDEKLHEISQKYKSGEMLTGEVKQILVDILAEIVEAHQERRSRVTDEMVKHFMDPNRPCLKEYLSKFK